MRRRAGSALALAAAVLLLGGSPAGPAWAAPGDELASDAPGVEYPVLEMQYPVIDMVFPEGTASGGLMQTGKKIALNSAVLFEKDKATLTSKAAAEIEELKRRVGGATPTTLKVDGYTDNVQGAVDNDKLSADRAEAIAKVLKAAFPAASIEAKGHGSADPVAPNDTEKGKAANRRVEVTVG